MTEPSAGPAEAFRYRAFVSYRHADKAWGDWLHRALEAYRVPKELVGTEGEAGIVPERVSPVFRDREELAASADLAREIDEALQASANLIVLCSPGAAASRWVNEEILRFKRLGRANRVFAIIVDGEPNAADPARECFPPALKFSLKEDGSLSDRPAEPIAADARDEGDGKENAKLKLIAGLIGVDYDRLRRRELEAQRRRFRRFAALAAVLVLVFAGLAGAAGWFAWQSEVQRAEADRQRIEAEAQRSEAQTQRDRAEQALASARGVGDRLVKDIVQRMRNANGAQADVLQAILQEVSRLMDELSAVGGTSASDKRTRATALYELVISKTATGDLDGALADAMECLSLFENLAAEDPANPSGRYSVWAAKLRVGDVHYARGDLDEAFATFNAALDIAKGLYDETPDDALNGLAMALTHQRIGDTLVLKGDRPGARNAFEASLGFSRGVAEANPGSLDRQSELAQAYSRLGDYHYAVNAYEPALTSYRAAREINLRVAEADGSNLKYQEDVAFIHAKVGDVELSMGDIGAAELSYSASVRIRDGLVKADPSNQQFQRDLFLGWYKVSDLARAKGAFDAMRDACTKALEVAQRLRDLDPSNARARADLSSAESCLGEALYQLDDFDSARAHLASALKIDEERVAADPSNTEAQHDLYLIYGHHAQFEVRRGDFKAALPWGEKAAAAIRALAARHPDHALWQDELAMAEKALVYLKAQAEGG